MRLSTFCGLRRDQEQVLFTYMNHMYDYVLYSERKGVNDWIQMLRGIDALKIVFMSYKL
jgi:hypothetical protein